MVSILLFMLLFVLTLPAYAVTTFVSTSGSDANACGAGAGSPKLTIAACAACNTTPGDICQIEGGPDAANPFVYTGNLDSSVTTLVNGTSANPMVLKVTPGEFVVIRPSATVCEVLDFTTTDHWTVDGNSSAVRGQVNHLILDGLNLGCGSQATHIFHQGSGSTGLWLKNLTLYRVRNSGTTYGNAVSGQSAVLETAVGSNLRMSNFLIDYDHPTAATIGSHGMYLNQAAGGLWLEDCEVKNTAAIGIQLNHSGGTVAHTMSLIERCSVHDVGKLAGTTRVAIYINNNQADYTIRNTQVYNSPTHGIVLAGQRNADARLYNNTIFNNGAYGIAMAPSTDLQDTAVRNNLLYNNSSGGIRVFSFANNAGDGNSVIKNLCWKASGSCGSNAVVVDGTPVDVTVSGTISGNPLLINPNGMPPDVHLQTGSAAIDAGDNLAEVTDDYADTTRSGTNDVGAYTFGTTVLPNHLAFTSPPVSGTIVGAELPDVVVEVLDAAGARQTSDTGNCVASKATGTGTLGGTLTRAVSSGLCTFDDLTFDAADNDFSITVTKSGGTAADPVTSLLFSVVTAPAGQGPATLILRQY